MGYQDAVQQELGDAAAVWGPELNGGNSRNVLTHLDEWVLFRKPDLVKINCGLHDLRKELAGSGPPVPLLWRINVPDSCGEPPCCWITRGFSYSALMPRVSAREQVVPSRFTDAGATVHTPGSGSPSLAPDNPSPHPSYSRTASRTFARMSALRASGRLSQLAATSARSGHAGGRE